MGEELLTIPLVDFLMVDNVLKQLSPGSVLHDEVELLGCLDDLVKLNDVGVPNQLQDVDFSGNSLDVRDLGNHVLLQDFHCHFFACENVDAELDLSKGALADVLA